MNISKLKSIFPLEVMVTKEIIESSDVQDIYDCIGTNTLRKVLNENGFNPNYKDLHWGAESGFIDFQVGYIKIGSFLDKGFKQEVDMMEIEEPTKVFLKLI